MTVPSVLILGASGRIGGMLRQVGMPGLKPLWQVRHPVHFEDAVIFDPLGARPNLEQCEAVLGLAGVISGSPESLSRNSDLALAALEFGVACGARRVFIASTAAVYGRAFSPLSENVRPEPVSDYGRAKAEMEKAAMARAAQLGLALTVLRIGNVAGADALLGQPTDAVITLDRFPDGQGPRRSYIGPGDLAAVMGALLSAGAEGRVLPEILNLALPGAVAMEDLLHDAGRNFAWKQAPEGALPDVTLDVSRLAQHVPLPQASAGRIVADWQAYRQGAA